MSVYEKMWSGELYNCADEELAAEQTRALELLADYNACRPSEKEKRTALLKQMFAEIGEHDREFYFRGHAIRWDELELSDSSDVQ